MLREDKERKKRVKEEKKKEGGAKKGRWGGRKREREKGRKEKKSGIAKRGRTARGPLLLHMLYHLEIWTKSIFQRICSDKV